MLAAALALFSDKGYHNVSMQEIAEKLADKILEEKVL